MKCEKCCNCSLNCEPSKLAFSKFWFYSSPELQQTWNPMNAIAARLLPKKLAIAT